MEREASVAGLVLMLAAAIFGLVLHNDDCCAAVCRHGSPVVPWLDTGLRIVEVDSPHVCFGNEGSHFLKAVVGILVMFVGAGWFRWIGSAG